MKKRNLYAACLVLFLTGCGSAEVKTTYEKGAEALEAGAYETAVSAMDEVIAAGYRLPESYRIKGIASMELKEYPEAIAALQRSLNSLDISNRSFERDTLYYLAEARNSYGEPARAIEIYNEINAREPEWQACYLRGKTYFKLKDYEKASADFVDALQMNGAFDLYVEIYQLCEGTSLEKEAAAWLENALQMKDNTAEGYYNRGRAYYHLREYEKAERELKEALNQGNTNAMLLLGQVYLVKKDPASARNMYQQALQKEEEKSRAYNGLALCDIFEEKYDNALKNIEKGLHADGGNARKHLLYNEIVVYERKLDFEMAKEKMNTYLKLYPNDKAAQREAGFLESR